MASSKGGVGGKLDTWIGYLEGISRQLPKAVEAINRTTTALAAYRLEFAKNGDHDAAVKYAQQTVNNTQFLYSATNRPPVFNHPLARLSLQFKQYGQGMYFLIGSNIGKAIEGRSPGERAEAIKTLTGIAATHMAFAGLLGLTTEPFKYLLMLGNASGVTNKQWSDVEDQARKLGDAMFGKTAGEAIMKGLPRLLGIDLSSRVGLDSLTSFGEPRGRKDSEVKSWLFDTVAGAPISLAGDWVKGANAFMTGDFQKAAELAIPIKMLSDWLRAYRQGTEGKKSAASGRETMTPYTWPEVGIRAMGFTPAREAEQGQKASSFYRNQARDKDKRQELIKNWVTAKPSGKASAMKAAIAAGIKPAELTATAKRREDDVRKGNITNGIKTNKRDKHLLEDSPYNIRQKGANAMGLEAPFTVAQNTTPVATDPEILKILQDIRLKNMMLNFQSKQPKRMGSTGGYAIV